MEKRIAILVLLLAWSCAVPAFAQLVEVHGFRMEGQQVVVEYTLTGVEAGAPLQVSLHWLEQGSARENDCLAVAGAVGDQAAQPGRRQQISWDLLADYPMGMSTPEVSFVVKVRQMVVQPPIPEGFVLVRGGSFQMGSSLGFEAERPVHSVTVSDFLMGEHEVTQRLWQQVMGGNPSYFKAGNGQEDCPVEQVNWYDAVEFCNALSEREGLLPCYSIDKTLADPNNRNSNEFLKWTVTCDWTANGYRLPTEAEWEYAAGGGSSGRTEWAGTDSEGSLGSYAWYVPNAEAKTHPVGQKSPNRLGLYDMGGNVWEWCWDWQGPYDSDSQTNPTGPSWGSLRGLRGGSWFNGAQSARVAFRIISYPGVRSHDHGFRLVRSAPSP